MQQEQIALGHVSKKAGKGDMAYRERAGPEGAASAMAAAPHLKAGSFDVLGDVHDLSQSRHAQRDILGRYTSIVKSVEGHLSGGLSNGLRSNCANHFTRESHCLQQQTCA